MSKRQKQRFIAYRAMSDEYEIRFLGGPLDGARIATDVYPDCREFVHQVNARQYRYLYRQVAKTQFDAIFIGQLSIDPERPSQQRASLNKRLVLLVVGALIAGGLLSLWNR